VIGHSYALSSSIFKQLGVNEPTHVLSVFNFIQLRLDRSHMTIQKLSE
jgi:hypothetical protein